MSTMPLQDYNTPDCWTAILTAYANEVALSEFERGFIAERLKILSPGTRIEAAAQTLARTRWTMPQTKVIAEMYSKSRRTAEEAENSEDVGANNNCAKVCTYILANPGHSASFYANALGMRRDTVYRMLCGFVFFNTNKAVVRAVTGLPTSWVDIRREFVTFFRRHQDAPESRNYVEAAAEQSPATQDQAAAAAADAETDVEPTEATRVDILRQRILSKLESAIANNAGSQEINALSVAYAALV